MKLFAARSTRPSVFTTSTWRTRVRVMLASPASPRRLLRKKPLRKRILWLSSRYMKVTEPCHWSVYQCVSSSKIVCFPVSWWWNILLFVFILEFTIFLSYFFFFFSYFYFPLFPSHLNLISLGFPKSSFLAASSERPISLWDSHSFFFPFLFFSLISFHTVPCVESYIPTCQDLRWFPMEREWLQRIEK